VNGPSKTADAASAFTAHLFAELERQGIEYVIARRADLLSAPPVGDDIDVVVRRDRLKGVAPLLKELADEHGGHCLAVHHHVGSRHHVFFFPGAQGEPVVRHLHFQDSINHRGVDLAPGAEMLRERRKDGDYWRPSPEMEAASLLVHDLVGKAAFRRRDLEEMRSLSAAHPEAFVDALERLVGADAAQRMAACLDGDQSETLLSLGRLVRHARLRRQPLRFVSWWLAHLLRTVSFLFRRRGALVVLIGPDGSGKTTLIDEAYSILTACELKVERVYFGARTPMLPTKRLMRAFHARRAPAGPSVNEGVPKNAGFKSKLTYFLGTAHSAVDQYLRYFVTARPLLARARILLCDRYFYDALATPAPAGLKRLVDWSILWLTPRADHVFVLEDDPQAIHDRKPELSVDEIGRQQRQFERLKRRPLFGGALRVQPDPHPNALEIARTTLRVFGQRNA
jgi:thymidylate kinase